MKTKKKIYKIKHKTKHTTKHKIKHKTKQSIRKSQNKSKRKLKLGGVDPKRHFGDYNDTGDDTGDDASKKRTRVTPTLTHGILSYTGFDIISYEYKTVQEYIDDSFQNNYKEKLVILEIVRSRETNNNISNAQANRGEFYFFNFGHFIKYIKDSFIFPCYQASGIFNINLQNSKPIISPFTGEPTQDIPNRSMNNIELGLELVDLMKGFENILVEKKLLMQQISHLRRNAYTKKFLHLKVQRKMPIHQIAALAKKNEDGMFQISMSGLHCNQIQNETNYMWEFVRTHDELEKAYYGIFYDWNFHVRNNADINDFFFDKNDEEIRDLLQKIDSLGNSLFITLLLLTRNDDPRILYFYNRFSDKIDFTLRNRDNLNILHLISLRNHPAFLQTLYNDNVITVDNVEQLIEDDSNGNDPVIISVHLNHVNLFNFYIEKLQISLSKFTKNSHNLLHIACEKGYFDIIKILLQSHIPINEGENPMISLLLFYGENRGILASIDRLKLETNILDILELFLVKNKGLPENEQVNFDFDFLSRVNYILDDTSFTLRCFQKLKQNIPGLFDNYTLENYKENSYYDTSILYQIMKSSNLTLLLFFMNECDIYYGFEFTDKNNKPIGNILFLSLTVDLTEDKLGKNKQSAILILDKIIDILNKNIYGKDTVNIVKKILYNQYEDDELKSCKQLIVEAYNDDSKFNDYMKRLDEIEGFNCS
tara:strand:- start:26 stop:2149 length:2124 start_codon:yes stop_codon:yes gene_type:complete